MTENNVRKIASIVRGHDLTRLCALQQDDHLLLARITAAGVPPSQAVETLRAYDPNETYEHLPATANRKILAYSFLRDRQQYSGIYEQTDEWAGKWAGILATRPDDACAEIAKIVDAKLKARGSDAVAVVTPGLVPGTANIGAGALGPDQHYKPLQALAVATSSQAIGAFPLDVTVDEDAPPGRRYRMVVGGGLFAAAQSKQTAGMAARLCFLFGRNNPAIAPYIGYLNAGEETFHPDIAEDVWDGRKVSQRPPSPPREKMEV